MYVSTDVVMAMPQSKGVGGWGSKMAYYHLTTLPNFCHVSSMKYLDREEEGETSSKGKFLKPTFLAQFWSADYENLCYMAI